MNRIDVDHLPSGGIPKPVWLWFSDPTPSGEDTDTAWHAFLRRFDLERTFRFLKQTLGWTRPRLRGGQPPGLIVAVDEMGIPPRLQGSADAVRAEGDQATVEMKLTQTGRPDDTSQASAA
ncbi:hypothetical protein ACFWP2_36195 [Kitasatospora sp. NPDC058444]|uniref:hypothetical protein n=1 Tax=Kitasatospora sp. NPDC058444 TaxID=3346504 RepID=UPI00364DDA99